MLPHPRMLPSVGSVASSKCSPQDSRPTACQYRTNTPQKCRLKNPHFGLPPPPPRGRGGGGKPGDRCSMAPGPPPGKMGMVVLREIVMIHDLRRQGLGISAIARRTGLDRKTVRKHLDQGLQSARYGPRQPRPRLLDPYEDYLRERIADHEGLSGYSSGGARAAGGRCSTTRLRTRRATVP